MKKEEINLFVSELLNKGFSLSDIQKKLHEEKNVTMTFLDLRILASELDKVDWSKQKSDMAAAEAEKKAEEKKAKANLKESETAGKTIVEISRIKRSGALANGSVVFASGAKAEWILDQMGHLALDNQEGEPTQDDIQEFQLELQNMLTNGEM